MMSGRRSSKRAKADLMSSPSSPESKMLIDDLKKTFSQAIEEMQKKSFALVSQERDIVAQIVTSTVNNTMTKVFDTIETISADLLKRIEKLESDVSQMEQLKSEKQEMASRIVILEEKLNQLEQDKLMNCMEISGADLEVQNSTKPLKTIVSDLLTHNSIPHNVDSIKKVQSREIKSQNGCRKLLTVTFTNYDEKMQVMKAKFMNDKGKRVKIYFDHSITKHNRILFNQARTVIKSQADKKAYIAKGRVYVKNVNEKFGVHISSFSDIEKLTSTPQNQNSPPIN
jgi:hypothetical protein